MQLFVFLQRSLAVAALALCACTGSADDPPSPPADATPPPVATATEPVAPDAEALAELDAAAESAMKSGSLPGVTMSIVRDGTVKLTRAWGVADLQARTPMTPETIVEVASISKPVTAVALMQLVQQGKVRLDEDVSTYLEKPVKHPAFADPITLRMLLTHTSSIVSSDKAISTAFRKGRDASITLASLVSGFLVPGGEFYSEQRFSAARPGTEYRYCNICLAVVAHVAERASGMPFARLTKERIFAPLGITSAAWMLADVDVARRAKPYAKNPTTGELEERPFIGFPDWPAGSLMITTGDLARFAAAMASAGDAGGSPLVDAATVDEMFRIQNPRVAPAQGLAFRKLAREDKTLFGHDGGFGGVSATMALRPGAGLAVVVVANGDWQPDVQEAKQPLVILQSKAFDLVARF